MKIISQKLSLLFMCMLLSISMFAQENSKFKLEQRVKPLSESELTEALEKFAANDYPAPTAKEFEHLVPELLHHIGSTNFKLRDKLIYSAMWNWMINHNAFSKEQMKEMLAIVTQEDYMFKGIDKPGSDDVFTRTFSILVIPLILDRHLNDPFLSKEEIYGIKDDFVRFMTIENDRRGFVAVKGWAHATAHAADIIDALIFCKVLEKSEQLEILESLTIAISRTEIGYLYGEDNRMITGILAIADDGKVSDEELNNWIESLGSTDITKYEQHERILLRTNLTNFLKSLYFRMKWTDKGERFNTQIEKAIQKLSWYYPKDN